MASQAVITAPHEMQPDNGHEAARMLRARKRAKHKEWLAGLAFYAFAGAILALFPMTRHLIWNMVGLCVTILAVDVVKYLREFHPSLLPPVLQDDSPLRVRLSRIKKALSWTFWAAAGLGMAFVLLGGCGREDPPILFMAAVLVVLLAGSGFGFLGVAVYLSLRSANPATRAGTATYWPRAPRPISEYKPFQSEHWGRAREL